MIFADESLMKELSPLQKGVLEHLGRFTLAEIALRRKEWRSHRFFECCLVRIPWKKLKIDSVEERNAFDWDIVSEYRLSLVRDIPLRQEKKPVPVDNWPEKQFCHPENYPGRSDWEYNFSYLMGIGRNLDDMLANFLEQCDMLFDGWHLEMCPDNCEDRFDTGTCRAKWQEEIDEEECLRELEEERDEEKCLKELEEE